MTPFIAEEDYVIADIGMRILTPRELFRAQGFPDTYIIERGIDPQTGKEVKLSKTAQVKMCGQRLWCWRSSPRRHGRSWRKRSLQ